MTAGANVSTALHPFAGNTSTAGSRLVNDLPGGYWQHDLADHVLLVNNYFPPSTLLEELRVALPKLLGSYPSPHQQIAKQIGELIEQDPNRLVVCNGVAEIIPVLLRGLGLRIAVPTPSFNPYEYTALPGRLVRFPLSAPSFDLDVDEFASFVEKTDVDAAIVISPNNPTSRVVGKEKLVKLATRLGERGKMLLLDESFVEFADLGHHESLESDLDALSNVVVLKSLGKIYGSCGLRVGYVLSSNTAFAERLREFLPIWNVNSLAEFFLSRIGSLRSEAEASWKQVRADRDNLFGLLSSIPGMIVIPPHANFALCRTPDEWPDGPALADALLERHRILVRHNSGKTMGEGGRYLRIAARRAADNQRLVDGLVETAAAIAGRRDEVS
ncbi:aminotransferase class I/II-fold pyridoxal phosphate-dependent enzyme [Rhizobium sp. 007]|uniref:pyridoxal phosphate-dependent aminotransferase n=1 Tax=Rhizobium sp. 007 TaxID=2785056 RepID=UPI00188E44CB|nr:aminotransferase class I/II-fold pyridoxal phosphate-dependent enzyme [Rhizobium sp. 007]QPB24487.1 aminotransferase class I/II-fold pyridoxal phosphate-dependent enzyme [Rhizobium sp. 007]